MTRFVITVPPLFDFLATIRSHGWAQLPPFSWDADAQRLQYIMRSAAGDAQRLQIREGEGVLQVDLPDSPERDPQLESEARSAVARMFNLDWDLSAFYAAMRAYPGYSWLEGERRGRILISPSLWEDLAKALLTTNCSWSQTINMTRQLCQLGLEHPTLAGCHAFPSPGRIASLNGGELAQAVRAGYRTAWLHELARKISNGAIDLEAWRKLDSESLFNAVKSLKGFGDYAAGTVARMLSHFDRIAIDSACHAMYAERHNANQKAKAKSIAAYYERFGKWRGLVMWMEIMRHYADKEAASRG